MSEYKSKYYEIINFLKSWDAGYASSNYYASDSIVVLNKNGGLDKTLKILDLLDKRFNLNHEVIVRKIKE